ncbi:MAG: AAA family ATPase, partial [Anaerolineae bacterium]|nr:AAA family ATPase [Anaerolineae bacterium]
MVETQRALEEALSRTLAPDDPRFVICHRGTLDPLAYWLDRGWTEEAFFTFTGTTREAHYQRYAAVIHLVTAADGALPYYKRWPDAHRPETPEQAIHLDRLLEQIWGEHHAHFRIDNRRRDWEAKSAEAKHILSALLVQSCA